MDPKTLPIPALRTFSLMATVLAATVLQPGCGQSQARSDSTDTRLQVVCTTGQVGDIANRVGGEHIRVTSIMGPSVDPHLYKANSRDIDEFNRADLIFYNGLHLEGRLADLLENSTPDRPTYAVTSPLLDASPKVLRESEEFEGHYDPHVWFDPTIWVQCVQFVGERLAEHDPDNKDTYLKNAKAYSDEILNAHKRWQEQLASIEDSRRVLITAHDAFGYFGNAYDVEVRGLQGISTADETDVSTVEELIELLVSRKIKAVFVESSVSDRSVRSLIEGCQARGHTVVIGGELFSDAMGPADTPEGTYRGMMDHNVQTMLKALK